MSVTDLRSQVQRDEGLRLKVYADQLGHPTIGYGRALDTHGITEAEANDLLTHDLADVTREVGTELPWSAALSLPRLGVLQNLAFVLGIGGLLGFRKMLAAMQAEDWSTAAKELLDSEFAQQDGDRAHRLATQFETDQWV